MAKQKAEETTTVTTTEELAEALDLTVEQIVDGPTPDAEEVTDMVEEFEILTTFNGSPNGCQVVEYNEGDVVPSIDKPFPPELAAVAVAEGWAKAK